MPIIKSAKKRVRVANKAATRNSKTKRNLKTALKAFNAKPASTSHKTAQSKIDIALKKGVISKHKAARLKSRAAAQAKNSKVNLSDAAKKTNKKPVASKGTVKKTIVKKPTQKKTKS
jgi:small subunit ribosomal protein S20